MSSRPLGSTRRRAQSALLRHRRTAPFDGRTERGSAVLEFPLVVGLILIPFGALVLSIPTWIERQTAARDAAGEVARALVVDPVGIDPARLAAGIEAGYDLPVGTLRVEVPPVGGPGEPLTVVVTTEIPALVLPVFGDVGRVDWTTEHTERIPDYGATP